MLGALPLSLGFALGGVGAWGDASATTGALPLLKLLGVLRALRVRRAFELVGAHSLLHLRLLVGVGLARLLLRTLVTPTRTLALTRPRP